MDFELYYVKLFLPLLRLTATMCIGLLAASLLESFGWVSHVARFSVPLARMGHVRDVSAASFALAFVSPAASNSLLAEAHARGELSRRELVFANLFNSSPTFLVHLPTLFSMVFAFLGPLAFVYVGLTFFAAALRTVFTLLAGRLILPVPKENRAERPSDSTPKRVWRNTATVALRRFKKRIVKLLVFTVPIYILFFALQQAGLFSAAEQWLAGNSDWFGFLNPKSLTIVAMHLVAEPGAALSAAASMADTGGLTPSEIIMALLVGNIVAAPMRAVRHQFPSYAGYFTPPLALRLVIANQLCRALSLVCVTAAYYWYAF